MKKNILIIIFLTLLFTSSKAIGADKLTGLPIGTEPTKAEAAFDGDAQTSYQTTQSSYGWVGLDLGEKYVLDSVKIITDNSDVQTVLLGMFMGANKSDLSDGVPVAMIVDETKLEYPVTSSRGFRYVYYVGPANSHCHLSELEFYGAPGDGDDGDLWQITNLPTVVINTVDGEIPYDKEHDISSTVIIISEDGTNVLQQSKTNIRERGNYSRYYPKKPWRIKFDKKQNVLDAPAKAKKWTLINNYGDKTLMRNMLAFEIAKKLGMEWVPYCTPVDVVLNGEYKGCYQLCDQVEVNEGRLEIEEMTPEDNSGEALTGGYFVEVDAYAEQEKVWFTTEHYSLPITIKSPDDDEITEEQLDYITNYFNTLEAMMTNQELESDYRDMFDTDSFIRHMLVNEVAGNTDTYWSTNMYKRRSDPKIYTGPVWDFDLGFDNDIRTYPVAENSGNGYLWNARGSQAGNMRSFARRVIITDPLTKDEISEIWSTARQDGLSAEWLNDKVDEFALLIDESQKLNFMRWPILDKIVHQNPVAWGSFEAECNSVKQFNQDQIAHLDQVIGYNTEGENETDGVESVAEESSPIEYYTLTGIRIQNPTTPGIYIEKKGNRARKLRISN